jgi:hypothetical protein
VAKGPAKRRRARRYAPGRAATWLESASFALELNTKRAAEESRAEPLGLAHLPNRVELEQRDAALGLDLNGPSVAAGGGGLGRVALTAKRAGAPARVRAWAAGTPQVADVVDPQRPEG